MSRLTRIASVLMVAMLFTMIPSIDANSSGKIGQSTSGCNCHSTDAMIVPSITGLPSSYSPGTTYTLTWSSSSMSTNGQGGFNLDASAGTWSNLGARVKTVNGELTHSNDGARSWGADWIAPTIGTGDVTFNIAVLFSNANNGNSGDNWGTNQIAVPEGAPPPNTPPTVSNVALTPNGDVTTSQSFTVSYTFFDNDGDQEGPSQIRWFIDGNPAPTHNDAKTITGSSTSVGEVWTVEVTPHDGTDLGPIEQCPDSATIVDADSDNDGTPDGQDAFPNDPTETTDSDNDGTGDNADAFPNDPTETVDTDGDGTGDNADAFPNDSTETVDTDSDGTGDNADAFPTDPNEIADSDGDTVGDNADAFPNDPTETTDSDGDTVGDNADAFPNDPTETADTDGDTVGDNTDEFPNDATESVDTDNDGVGDNGDWAPNDPAESADTDGDDVGDNADLFPTDATESSDADQDMIGDNADTDDDNDGLLDTEEAILGTDPFDEDTDGDEVNDKEDALPLDATETLDFDQDGTGDNADTDDDNDGLSDIDELREGTDRFDTDSDDDTVMDGADVFPLDATETTDSDSDGVGDNADVFPNDANETLDSDSDGVGNNADAFPDDADETMDSDGNGVGDNEQKAQEDEDAAQMQLMIIIGVGLVLAVLGAVLFMRRKGGGDSEPKITTPLPVTEPLATSQPLYPTQSYEPVQPMQPVVAELTVENQWTDEAGHTWRQMSDGSNLWWNGSDWQKV